MGEGDDVKGVDVKGAAQNGGREYLFSEIMQQTRSKDGPTFRAIRNGRYRMTIETKTRTACEFFDLQEDPNELNNLVAGAGADLAKHADTMAAMVAAIDRRIRNSMD